MIFTQVCLSAPLSENRTILTVRISDEERYTKCFQGFVGFFEEQNLPVKFQHINLNNVLREEIVLSAVQENRPRLILTLGQAVGQFIAELNLDIPIIAGLVLNPSELTRNENMTFVVLEYPVASQLEWIKTLLPKVRKVGVLYNSEQNRQRVEEAKTAAETLGLELLSIHVRKARELPSALNQVLQHVDVLWSLPDNLVVKPATTRAILQSSLRSRVPLIGLSRSWVKAGAILALDWDWTDLGSQSGALAQKILEGTPPDQLPPEEPRKLVYTLNLKIIDLLNVEIAKDAKTDAIWIYN
ncbi:MAG: ABC transporter substrate-binding protein [Acidobacteriota bacterium]|nr:ABC transporter substrate-binding protein [Acidobacteriota bacterium]